MTMEEKPVPSAVSVWSAMRDYTLEQDRRRELRETVGLGRGSGRVSALLHIEQSPLTLADLAQRLDIEPPHATAIIDTLEERGYVTRQTDSQDRRRKQVVLTAAGRRVLRKVHAVVDRPPPEFHKLTEAQLTALSQIMATLRS
jgi:DNA-binding MarR family transcriptional regulator